MPRLLRSTFLTSSFLRFLVVGVVNADVVDDLPCVLVYNILGYDRLVAHILAAVIGVPVTFLFLKVIAFRSAPPTPR